METAHLSQQAYDRLQEELAERSGPRRKEISAWIERAREHGDIKENADYDAAKNEQGHNEARIRQLEQMLRTAVVVEGAVGRRRRARHDRRDPHGGRRRAHELPRRLDRGAPRRRSTCCPRRHRSGRRCSATGPATPSATKARAARSGRDRERPPGRVEMQRSRVRSTGRRSESTSAVNLVGHVAVALAPERADPPTDFLVGCMLPDLAAITRVRLTRPEGDLGRGVAFHHDVRRRVPRLRVVPSRRIVSCATRCSTPACRPAPARACSHAGSEMLLDGALVADAQVASARAAHARRASTPTPTRSALLAPAESRAVLATRLRMIGSSLEPRRYADARFVAERLQRMTAGRRRIEVRASEVDSVALVLDKFAPAIATAAPAVLDEVRRAVPSPHHPG